MAAIAAVVFWLNPHRTADLKITRTRTWQSHTAFKSDTIVVGQDTAEDNLYVLATLRIDDRLRLPLFIKDMTATLTTADGQTLSSNALEKTELPSLYQIFPAIKPLASAPLLRETAIQPGQFAEGMVLLQFQTTKDVWDHRKSAELTVDFYHQSPMTVTIPSEGAEQTK